MISRSVNILLSRGMDSTFRISSGGVFSFGSSHSFRIRFHVCWRFFSATSCHDWGIVKAELLCQCGVENRTPWHPPSERVSIPAHSDLGLRLETLALLTKIFGRLTVINNSR